MSDPEPNFENTLAQLEKTVNEIESNQLSLSQVMAAFEAGVTLTREAQTLLEEAQQKVAMLSNEYDGTLDGQNHGD